MLNTLGKGTSHLPAFSFRFCLTVLLKTLARSTYNRNDNTVSHQKHILKGHAQPDDLMLELAEWLCSIVLTCSRSNR